MLDAAGLACVECLMDMRSVCAMLMTFISFLHSSRHNWTRRKLNMANCFLLSASFLDQ